MAALAMTALVPSYISGENTATVLQLLFGLGAIQLAFGFQPQLPAFFMRFAERFFGRLRRPERAPSASQRTAADRPTPDVVALTKRPVAVAGLEAESVVVRFGGVVAVDAVGLDHPSQSNHRPHRSQRCRQDDIVQCVLRLGPGRTLQAITSWWPVNGPVGAQYSRARWPRSHFSGLTVVRVTDGARTSNSAVRPPRRGPNPIRHLVSRRQIPR